MNRLIAILLLSFACWADASEHAVVLAYHHVDSKTPPSTSVTRAEFRRHMAYLDEHGFTVLALGDIADRLERGAPIPDGAVAITFDDAYESVLTNAAPELKKRGWPFTVFVTTDAVDQGLNPYLSWDQLREIIRYGGEIGNHSARHEHMIRGRTSGSDSVWKREQTSDIRKAQRRIKDELDVVPTLFAFPYGEYNQQLVELLDGMGLTPVGQHSGAASKASSVIPRFPVSSRYASLDTLADKLSSLPFCLRSVNPKDGVLDAKASRPILTLEFHDAPRNPASLSCFVAGQEKATIVWDGRVASVQARQPLRPGRTKYNCTLPSSDRPGRFEWFSFLWMKPESESRWYSE